MFLSDLSIKQPVLATMLARQGSYQDLQAAQSLVEKNLEADPMSLGDQRLNGFEVEAKGHFTAPDRFLIDPIHTRAMLVRQGGKLRMVTYWCDICSIRSFTPRPCVCCQRDTTLDLRDPDEH